LLGLVRFAFDAGDREENDAEREIHHRLRNVGSLMVSERGKSAAPPASAKRMAAMRRSVTLVLGLTGMGVMSEMRPRRKRWLGKRLRNAGLSLLVRVTEDFLGCHYPGHAQKRLTKTLSDAPPRAPDCNRDATDAFAAATVRHHFVLYSHNNDLYLSIINKMAARMHS